MATLRSEKGCPWDKEQNLDSLKPYLLEEAYEVLDAIDLGDPKKHCEELGDLLLQVVFQAQICEEAGKFSFDDVARAISDKLLRRHPHVFGDVAVEDAAEVVRNWDDIKRQENYAEGKPPSIMHGVPKQLPALLKAQEVQKRAARVGFDWEDASGPQEKLDEELAELKEAIPSKKQKWIKEEIGDIFFSLVNLCRHLNINAEQTLNDTSRKFMQRFARVENKIAEQGLEMKNCGLPLLDDLWNEVKAEDK